MSRVNREVATMSYTTFAIDPNSTESLLRNLGLAIDEAKLVSTISRLQDQIYQIELSNNSSVRPQFICAEIERLENQLNQLREKSMHR